MDGKFNFWYFWNIIVVVFCFGEYDWVEDFINCFKDDFLELYKENVVIYNMV